MNGVEFRPIADDDLDQYFDIRSQAFGRPESERIAWTARASADADALRLGAYRGSELVGGLRVLPAGQWLDGRRVGMGGVAAVVVRPEFRASGIGRRLLFDSLTWMREHELAVSALHPATTRAYRRVGWEIAGDEAVYAIPTRSLASLELDHAVQVSRLHAADRGAVRDCYARYAPTRHGFVDRSPSFWQLREEVDDEDGGFTYGVRSGDIIAGYVRYRQQLAPDGWGYHLRVDDFIASDPATATALWRFFGGHAMQVESIEVPAPLLDELLLVLDEQEVRQLVVNRWMHRIVDLPRALSARGTRFGGRATITIGVTDPWPGSGASAWTIHADGGVLRAEPSRSAGLQTDIGALSAASIGRFPIRFLASAGRISGPADQIALLDTILASPRPELSDSF